VSSASRELRGQLPFSRTDDDGSYSDLTTRERVRLDVLVGSDAGLGAVP